MKKIRLSALALFTAIGAVAFAGVAPTVFYYNATTAESATAYKTAANWQLTPPVGQTCSTPVNRLACKVTSVNASTIPQLIAEIDAAGSAAQEVQYVRQTIADTFKP